MTVVRRAAPAALLTLALVAVIRCPHRPPPPGRYTVAGARELQPVMRDWVAEYGRFPARIEAGGTTAALRDVGTGDLHVAMVDRPLRPGERGFPAVVARELYAVVVHPENPVAGVTADELAGIFAGRITSWSALGGADAPIRVVVYGELPAALRRTAPEAATRPADSASAALAAVAGDRHAVACLPARGLDARVKALAVDGAAPTLAEAEAGRYRLTVPLRLVFVSAPIANRWAELLAFVRGPAGRRIARRHGLLPPDDAARGAVEDRLTGALDAWLEHGDPEALRRSVDEALAAAAEDGR